MRNGNGDLATLNHTHCRSITWHCVHAEIRVVCRISPRGQRFILQWGSNRYAMSGAAILLMWAQLPADMRSKTSVAPQDAQCAAVKQIHYMAGDNDRGSYIAGFGERPPLRNHHRNAACAPWEQAEDAVKHCEKCASWPTRSMRCLPACLPACLTACLSATALRAATHSP
jgi:Glycosyl hydrolase family 9